MERRSGGRERGSGGRERGSGARLLPLAPYLVLGLLLLGTWLAVMAHNGGAFTYASDDAYIHLALAENLARGHYGVNLSEPSAASSSVLWPLLLMPFAFLGLEYGAPLVLNVSLAFASLAAADAILAMALSSHGSPRLAPARLALVLACIPALNLVGLAFVGMEHILELLCCLLILAGLVRESRGGGVTWWLLAAMVLGPLVRYECLALTVPAIAYLAWRRHFRSAAAAVAAVALSLGAFSLYLRSLGLGALPTSVLAKSPVIGSAAALAGLASQLASYFGHGGERQGMVLLLGAAMLLGTVLFAREQRDRHIALWALSAASLYVAFGTLGFRHASAIAATTWLAVVVVNGAGLARLIERESAPRLALFVAAVTLVLFGPAVSRIVKTPAGANDVYLQQYQMHRFATQFVRAPVAVNDLGYVAYRNPYYVLDLIGLASLDALALGRGSRDQAWANDLAASHDVHVAMLYANAFPALPDNWVPVGDLALPRRPTAVAGRVVTIYAIDPESSDRVGRMLREFAETVPTGAVLRLR